MASIRQVGPLSSKRGINLTSSTGTQIGLASNKIATSLEEEFPSLNLHAAWVSATSIQEITGATTIATQNPDPIGYLPDLSGSGWHLASTGTGTRLIASTGTIGGNFCITNVLGSGNYLQSPTNFWNPLATGGFTLYGLVTLPPSSADYRFVFGDSAGNFNVGLLNNVTNYARAYAQNQSIDGGAFIFPSWLTSPFVFSLRWSATGTCSLWINNLRVREVTGMGSANLPATGTGRFIVGNAGNFYTYPYNGAISTVLVYNKSHSNAEAQAVLSYLYRKSGFYTPYVITDGNSLSTGYYALNAGNDVKAFSMENLLRGLLGPGWKSFDISLAGQTTTTKLARSQVNDLGTLLAPCDSGIPRPVVLWEGTNDMVASGPNLTGELAYANIAAKAQFYLNNGFKHVFVPTVLIRSAANAGAGFEARRVIYNNLLRTQGPIDGLIPIDLDQDTVLSNPASLTDTSVFPDGIHLLSAYYLRVAKIIAAAIKGVLYG